MSFDPERLYRLLPAIHRIRDLEHGAPLRALLDVIAVEVAVLEENLAQLYDDHFIETCAEWAVPYIGELLGERGLHEVSRKLLSQRALVGNAMALRRRKGTVAALEQVALDSTGFVARAVESFELLATTQYMNHLRLHRPAWVDLHDSARLEALATPFDVVAHTVDVRRIANNRGRFNIPHIAVFLWRIAAYSLSGSLAIKAGQGRYLFDPLGAPVRLYQRGESEEEVSHIVEPVNAPSALERRPLARRLDEVYGPQKSLLVEVDGRQIPIGEIEICNLSDRADGSWAHVPPDRFAIDPVLGRLALPEAAIEAGEVRVWFHYGFGSDLGGGEYARELEPSVNVFRVPTPELGSIQQAIDALLASSQTEGVVEILDSGRYQEALSFDIGSRRIAIRAVDGARPHLALSADMDIRGADGGELTLDGLLVSGGALRALGEEWLLRLSHTTLVPGLERTIQGQARFPDAASLIADVVGGKLEIARSIVGALRVAENVEVRLVDSIVDATAPDREAYGGVSLGTAGGPLFAEGTTLIGLVHALALEDISNSILLAESAGSPPVFAERRQRGCVRFSYLPLESIAPRRFRCQPAPATPLHRPELVSSRYGDAAYCQLDPRTPETIRKGADDESEMGVFHHLYVPQRESNLRVKFDEYVRFGFEAGIFYAS